MAEKDFPKREVNRGENKAFEEHDWETETVVPANRPADLLATAEQRSAVESVAKLAAQQTLEKSFLDMPKPDKARDPKISKVFDARANPEGLTEVDPAEITAALNEILEHTRE